MRRNTLFLLVEGDDDKRFLEKIIIPLLKQDVLFKIWQYSQTKKEKTNQLIHTINRLGVYIFLKDKDEEPCIREKKRKTAQIFPAIDEECLIIVVHEIESWYLAGLNLESRNRIGIKAHSEDTEVVTKEHFNRLIPKGPRISARATTVLWNFR